VSRTPSPRNGATRPCRRQRQRGFTLIEVMVASVILSVFVLGLSGLWQASSRRVDDMILKQKAVFVLNAEMERLTALYAYTTFGDEGPATSNNFNDNSLLPSPRLVYPTGSVMSTLMGGSGNNFVTTNFSSFRTGAESRVYVASSFLNWSNRAYVWIDRERNLAGRISWVTSEIDVNSCLGGDNCSCHDFDGDDTWTWLNEKHCRTLELFLEYPYRPTTAGSFATPETMQTMSLRTIVGRL
jgi:prepilin-type N-terminal cleavage/methylation domain-containing protein